MTPQEAYMAHHERARRVYAMFFPWARDTSSDPDHWSPTNPAWGQCAVTALLIQDAFGGDLLRAVVRGDSHYWNRLPDGAELDFTRAQFFPFKDEEFATPETRTREYVLSHPETARRYEILRDRWKVRSA